jgi:hypothetical protein
LRRLLTPALLLALAACNPGFEPQYRVTDLRILGVRASVVSSTGCLTSTPPSAAPCADVTPDDTLTLETLVVPPPEDPGKTSLSVRWYACAPTGTDAVPPCIDDAVLSDPEAIATMPGVIALPTTGTGERVTVALAALPQDAVQAALAAAEARATQQPTYQCRMFVEVPVVVIATDAGKRDVALKRVRLVPRDTPFAYKTNANPQLRGVFRGTSADQCSASGVSLSAGAFPAGRVTLCGAHDNEGTYAVCDAAGNASPTTESYGWQWYVTAGDFPDAGGVGNATDDAPDFDRPPGPFTLWAILRDGRGGEDWLRVDVP